MLTAPFVSTVTVKQRTDYPDDKVKGLVLRVTPTGVKTWCLRYRIHGESKRYTLGSTESLSLSKARERARKTLGQVSLGIDPAEAKRKPATGHTIDALARDYLNFHAKVNKRSWKADVWRLRRHVLAHWKDRKVTDITRRDVRAVVEGLTAQGFPTEANRVKSLISTMFRFGIRRDWLEVNPASDIDKATVAPSRNRVLTDEEIRLFWRLCEQEVPAVAAFLKLRLVTAQRGGELVKLTWADVEAKDGRPVALNIPEHVAKNGRAHHVTLSKTAVALLESLPLKTPHSPSDRLFPGHFGSGRGAERRYMDAAGRVTDRMTALARQSDPAAVVDIRGHDLRRTAATKMAQAGIPTADISRVLNHVEAGPKASQVYQRYEFDKEKRIALETWARVLTGILEEKDTKAALPFTRKR